MVLDEQTLKSGKKFIVGTWRVDYLVNAFSNDLAHIPASEFKSDDGRDFGSVTFEFFEDNTLVMREEASGREEKGTWDQTGLLDYHYTLNAFFEIPEGAFRENAEKLSVTDGDLVFSIGFLAVALKKIADGKVTEEPDIGDLPGDPSMTEVVGRYAVAKVMAMVGGEFGLFSLGEIEADFAERKAAGEDDEGLAEYSRAFSGEVEFTADHRVLSWSAIPEGVTPEQIEEALKAGEIAGAKDGLFCMAAKEWKAAKGSYWVDSGEERETFGEKQSSWDEFRPDENGLWPFAGGSMMLRRAD